MQPEEVHSITVLPGPCACPFPSLPRPAMRPSPGKAQFARAVCALCLCMARGCYCAVLAMLALARCSLYTSPSKLTFGPLSREEWTGPGLHRRKYFSRVYFSIRFCFRAAPRGPALGSPDTPAPILSKGFLKPVTALPVACASVCRLFGALLDMQRARPCG